MRKSVADMIRCMVCVALLTVSLSQALAAAGMRHEPTDPFSNYYCNYVCGLYAYRWQTLNRQMFGTHPA